VPYAQANMAPIPDALSDRQVVLLADIASTGFSAAEKAGLGLGDTVAIFAQGPIGLCASMGARLKGAGLIIAVDVVAAIRRLTQGRGVDVAIEALGRGASCRFPQRQPGPQPWELAVGVSLGTPSSRTSSPASGPNPRGPASFHRCRQ
jgi:threonine dehydrogenase-like Zn-dependent dehydrogenase